MPINTGRETELLSGLMEEGWEITFAFARHSKLNDWAIKFYESIGVSACVRDLSAIPETVYYNVVHEFVIEVTLDTVLAALVKKAGLRAQGTMRAQELRALSRTRGEVQFKVFKNKLLADSLRALV